GWLDVELTPEGREDPVLGSLPPRTQAFQWHHYTYEVPAGGTELARSEVCTQAFRLGRAWGVQFHAEVTASMIDAWLLEDPEDVADLDFLRDRKSTRLNSSHDQISYAVFCLKKKIKIVTTGLADVSVR